MILNIIDENKIKCLGLLSWVPFCLSVGSFRGGRQLFLPFILVSWNGNSALPASLASTQLLGGGCTQHTWVSDACSPPPLEILNLNQLLPCLN